MPRRRNRRETRVRYPRVRLQGGQTCNLSLISFGRGRAADILLQWASRGVSSDRSFSSLPSMIGDKVEITIGARVKMTPLGAADARVSPERREGRRWRPISQHRPHRFRWLKDSKVVAPR